MPKINKSINMLRTQSDVSTCGKKQHEHLPRKIGNVLPSPRMPDDEYSLPLTVVDFTKGTCRHRHRHRFPVTSILASDNSDGTKSDDVYETKESLEKELPESSGNKDKEISVFPNLEAEDKFPRPKEESRLPRYDPKLILQMKFSRGFVDCHCHLDFLFHKEQFNGSFKDYQRVHKDTFPDSFEGCVAVFCDPDTFNKKYIWQNILSEDNVWAAFGCHPKKSKFYSDRCERFLIAALGHHQVKALGEIGLDYSDRNKSDKETQHDVFRRQLKIAKWRNLPLVIHCREAHEDTLEIMKEIVPRDYKIHLHCFSDVWKHAQIWLNTFPNLCIGITNLVTFRSAKDVHQVVKNIPLNRLLLETDAPYFVPKIMARKRSHPGMALHVAAQIAALRGDSLENIVQLTRQNAYQIYGI